MTSIGVFFGLLLTYSRSVSKQVELKDLLLIACFALAGAALGSKTLFFLTQMPILLQDFSFYNLAKTFITSGFVFYGGLLGALGACRLLFHYKRWDTQASFNLILPGIICFHAFGRVGCFLAGCCYGRVANWGVVMTGVSSEPRIPVQLFEALFESCLLIGLLLYERQCVLTGKTPDLLRPYLFLYAVFRFFLEFFRGDTLRGIWFGLSTSQYISLILLTVLVGKAIFKNARLTRGKTC